jgi:hypothetical protein
VPRRRIVLLRRRRGRSSSSACSLRARPLADAENRERDAVYALLRDQARGDARPMLATPRRLSATTPRCRRSPPPTPAGYAGPAR